MYIWYSRSQVNFDNCLWTFWSESAFMLWFFLLCIMLQIDCNCHNLTGFYCFLSRVELNLRQGKDKWNNWRFEVKGLQARSSQKSGASAFSFRSWKLCLFLGRSKNARPARKLCIQWSSCLLMELAITNLASNVLIAKAPSRFLSTATLTSYSLFGYKFDMKKLIEKTLNFKAVILIGKCLFFNPPFV